MFAFNILLTYSVLLIAEQQTYVDNIIGTLKVNIFSDF